MTFYWFAILTIYLVPFLCYLTWPWNLA